MRPKLQTILILMASSLVLEGLHGQVIINASFESDVVAPNTVDRSRESITGWTTSANLPDLANSTLAPNLAQYVFLFGPGTSFTEQESVGQTIATTPGQLYTVSFEVRGGTQNDWSAGDFSAGFSSTWLGSSSGGGFNWTGSSAALTFQAAVNGTPALNVVDPGTTQWNLRSFTFVGTGSDTLVFKNLGDTSAGTAYTVFSLDNISITAVPEPSIALLLTVGAVILVSARRLGRRRAVRG